MIDRINTRQLVRILELHRRGNSTGEIADQVFGSDNRSVAVVRALEAYGQTPRSRPGRPDLYRAN